MLKKIIIGAVVLILIAVGVGAVFGAPARAAEGDEPCVPSDAWTETIEHPAVTHVVHHDAVTHEETVIDVEGVDIWWHWNGGPDGPQGNPPPYEGWNTDNGNHNGFPDDVNVIIQRDKGGSGNSDWFYHQVVAEQSHVITVVDQEAYDETVVDEEAWTETIEHEAVVCDPEIPEQPDPIVREAGSATYHCGDAFQTQYHGTATTEYVWDEEAWDWVLGEQVIVNDPPVQVPVDVVPCKDKPEPNQPVKHVSRQNTVPLVIDAGL